MSLMLRLQVLTIAVAALSIPFVRAELGDTMPPAMLLAHHLVVGAFLGWWILTIVWIRWRGGIEDTPDAWYPHTLKVFWFGNVAVVAASWLSMPYADAEMRLVNAMLCISPVVVEVMGTVRAPTYGRRGVMGTLAPLGIPIGLSAWYLMSGDRQRYAVVFFYVAFTAALLLLREFLQRTVDAGYAAKAEAEAARDAKARFMAAASHDLGQPLQAARLFFDQAMRAGAEAPRRAAATRVTWAFSSMEQQLRQMLDHLKLEAREVAAESADVPLGAAIARVTELHEPAARLAGVRIVAVPTRLQARGDVALIERALGNFLGNAIRHAAARRVLVGARRSGGRVRLWVVDDGRGVAEGEREGLFDDYVQGAWSAGDEVRGGFGLGLSSARRMAELMGGSAGHDPRWKGGSAFWLELPGADGLAS